MAVSLVSEAVSGTADDPDASHSSASFANTNGNIIVAVMTLEPDEADEASISDTQSLTWTEAVADTSADNQNMRAWWAVGNGTATVVTVSGWTTTGGGANVSLILSQCTGQHATVPIGDTDSNHRNGSTKEITLTLTTASSDNLVLTYHGGDGVPGSGDVPTGYTEGVSIGDLGGNDAEAMSASKAAAGGGDNHQWGDSSTFIGDRTALCIEILTAAAGGADQEPALVGGKLTNSLLLEHLVR